VRRPRICCPEPGRFRDAPECLERFGPRRWRTSRCQRGCKETRHANGGAVGGEAGHARRDPPVVGRSCGWASDRTEGASGDRRRPRRPLSPVGRFGLLGLLHGGLGKPFSRTAPANAAVAQVCPLAKPVQAAADALRAVVSRLFLRTPRRCRPQPGLEIGVDHPPPAGRVDGRTPECRCQLPLGVLPPLRQHLNGHA